MALRVRKLAKELRREPVEVLGILHALGYTRYRSIEDQLPSTVVAKVRKGVRQGVQPLPMKPARNSRAQERELLEQAGSDDLMSQLVPGVVKRGGGDKPKAAPATSPVPPVAPAPTPVAEPVPAEVPPTLEPSIDIEVSDRALQAQKAVLDSERRRLKSQQAVLEAEKARLAEQTSRLKARLGGLEAERESLDTLREALEAERAALDEERAALGEQPVASPSRELPTLQSLLEQRGLRGNDEFERAIQVLARQRLLRQVLWCLRVDGEEELSELLASKLVLVEGDVGEELAHKAAVSVAPNRAELPSRHHLRQAVAELGEILLLNGMRRVRLVGGRPVWHRMLRGQMDPRVEWTFLPAAERSKVQAEEDVQRTDLLILWNVDVNDEAAAVYETGRAHVVYMNEDSLGGFLQRLSHALGG